MTTSLLRAVILSLSTALLLSCGGGGGGGGGSVALAPGGGSAIGSSGAGGATTNPGGAGGGDTGIGGIGSADGVGGTGGTDGGGTSGDGSSTSASNGDDGSGVGSGGTGVSTAAATGVGSVDGAGSIIVNGLRYDTTNAVGNIQDAPTGLQLGMSAKVIGPVNADFTSGVALRVESAADLRGPMTPLPGGSFEILGTTVTTDDATVWADASGLAAIPSGRTLQVWGLPAGPGMLRATRVEQREASSPILSGTVQNLDTSARTFVIGGVTVDYGAAAAGGSVEVQALANGTLVRVRADAFASSRLIATRVALWYPLPTANDATVQLAGVVTAYTGLGSLRVLGVPVDASAAQITGGPIGAVGNGVKVTVGGVMSNGVLKATRLKIRNVPGTGGPASFDLIGAVGAFGSPSDFRVKGQPVNAGGAGVVFTNGSAANLRNGVKVHVVGRQVIDGVLQAQSVTFE